MNDRRKRISQNFIYGNLLNGRVSQPEAPVKTQKRVNDFALENPRKRPHTEGDTGHGVHSTAICSGLPEKSVAASSAQRKGAPDALSLRSSADRSANGKGLEEYRSTEIRVGLGKHTRRRRREKARRSSDGLADDGSETCSQTNSSARYKSRNGLLSLRMPSDDPIQDDDEEEPEVKNGPGTRASVINARPNARTVTGNSVYTISKYTSVDESDDELSVDQPAGPKSRSQRQTVLLSQATKNEKKRPSETGIGDEPQILPSAKRRTQPPNRADMRRTTFGPGIARVGDDRGGLRVDRAVCGPSHVYLAKGGTLGSGNKDCVLVSSTEGNSPFEAVDAVTREPIADLVWLTPKTSKVTRISRPRNSMTVKIAKSLDATAQFKTGPVLYLQFQNAHQAEQFVSRFCSVSDLKVEGSDMNIDALDKEMDIKLLQIVAYNEQPSNKITDNDLQYLKHKESAANRSKSKSSAWSPGLVAPQSKQAVDKRPLRERMRADNPGFAEENPKTKAVALGELSMTPEQVKQFREDFGDDSPSECQPQRIVRNEKIWQSPFRLGISQPEPGSQRSLRSAGPKPKSLSPAIERWTESHPDWANDWKVDLVYERTVVGKSDVERLDEGQLLNDEIITFYLKYLHKQLEDRDEQLAHKVYFFNSFFWEKLRPKRGTVNYEGVKNWTAKVDLLSFDYIIVPINEHAHWYVAMICNAKGLLSSHDTASDTDEPVLDKPQDQADGVAEDEVSEATANDTMKKIAVDVSHISIEDEPAETASKHHEQDKRTAATKETKALKRGNPRKYDPKATRVITLDSLDGTHSAVSTALKIYLQHEIEAKKGLRVVAPATIGMSARDIPTQPNFTDCGVYLLGYMREFMKDPDRFATSILQREERTWNFDAPTLRNEIRNLIFKLQKEYQQDQERHRRERAQARRQKPNPRGLAITPGSASRSSVEPPLRESPAPPPGSAANSRRATPLPAERSLSRAAIELDAGPAHEEPHSPPTVAGDTSVNINNVSMIVNVDESIEEIKVQSPSITPAPKPVESIELDSGDDAPEPSATRRTPATRHAPQNATKKTATPTPAYDGRKFLSPLRSSPAQSSPVKAEPFERSVVKVPVSHAGSVYARRHGAAKGMVTKSEVVPSSSEEEAGGKKVKKKKKSPTIDLTNE